MADHKKLTASVVGGGMGGRLSLQALTRSDRYELLAVADLRPEVCAALAQDFPGIRTFPDHRSMFAACPTDIVCVSTYPTTHEEVTIDALTIPQLKGILVEKPLGHTAASGRRILSMIKDRALPMVVPHGLHARKHSLEVATRVQRGEIGELKLVEVQSNHWDIINAGIHWLNYFVTLTNNEPLEYVMALCDSSTRTYRDGMQVETIAVTYAQTRSGVRVVMNTGDAIQVNRAGKECLFRLVGTAGQIEFWGWEPGYWLQNAQYPEGKLFMPEELPVSGHQRFLEALADMIEQKRTDYMIPESSLMALELCEGAYLSSRHRCQVMFPLENFTLPVFSDWHPGEPYTGNGGRDGRKLTELD